MQSKAYVAKHKTYIALAIDSIKRVFSATGSSPVEARERLYENIDELTASCLNVWVFEMKLPIPDNDDINGSLDIPEPFPGIELEIQIRDE